jgi:hypothetical protein
MATRAKAKGKAKRKRTRVTKATRRRKTAAAKKTKTIKKTGSNEASRGEYHPRKPGQLPRPRSSRDESTRRYSPKPKLDPAIRPLGGAYRLGDSLIRPPVSRDPSALVWYTARWRCDPHPRAYHRFQPAVRSDTPCTQLLRSPDYATVTKPR